MAKNGFRAGLCREAPDSTLDGTLFDDISCEIVRPEDSATTPLTATSAFNPSFSEIEFRSGVVELEGSGSNDEEEAIDYVVREIIER